MSKDIVLTGLALGGTSGICPCSNLDFSWAFNTPSNILWMDKLIVTREINDLIENDYTRRAEERAIKIIFQKLKDAGIVEIIENKFDKKAGERLMLDVSSDFDLVKDQLEVRMAGRGKKKQADYYIGDYHYCLPSLWTLYAAIQISYEQNASFYLTEREYCYLSKLIPIKYGRTLSPGCNAAIEEVLQLYLPNLFVGHSYLFCDHKKYCNQCLHKKQCKDSFLLDIEKQMDLVLSYRQYDEVRRTCDVMDKLCERSMMSGKILNGTELLDDLIAEAEKVKKESMRALKNIKTWSKITTAVSIGFNALTFINPIFGLASAVDRAASYSLSEKKESIQKNLNWVSFINRPERLLS